MNPFAFPLAGAADSVQLVQDQPRDEGRGNGGIAWTRVKGQMGLLLDLGPLALGLAG